MTFQEILQAGSAVVTAVFMVLIAPFMFVQVRWNRTHAERLDFTAELLMKQRGCAMALKVQNGTRPDA